MGFRQNHPYLFWQLIGWGIMLADAAFLVVSALEDFGEWCYPVIVFTFIAALFVIAVSPLILRLKRRRIIPQNNDEFTEKLLNGKIAQILNIRYGVGADVISAFLAMGSVIVFIMAAYVLGEHVSLALGFASLVLASASPFIIILIYYKRNSRKFFTVKNGEKHIELTSPADPRVLRETNPRTLIITGEPSDVLLNFFYNWLCYYLKPIENGRLVIYKISAPELCADYSPKDFLRYEDILFCIPEEQLDLTGERLALFRRECDAMCAFPFSVLVEREI